MLFLVDEDQNKERKAVEEEVTDAFDDDNLRKISCWRKFFCCCCKGKTERNNNKI